MIVSSENYDADNHSANNNTYSVLVACACVMAGTAYSSCNHNTNALNKHKTNIKILRAAIGERKEKIEIKCDGMHSRELHKYVLRKDPNKNLYSWMHGWTDGWMDQCVNTVRSTKNEERSQMLRQKFSFYCLIVLAIAFSVRI